MTYIVTIRCNGKVLITRQVQGMAQVERIQAVYEGSNCEVDFEADVFKYLRMNRNEKLS